MKRVEISYKTILFAIGLVILFKFLVVAKELLFSLFIAFIIMSALKPFVAFLERRRIPRFISSLFFYLLFLGSLFYVLFLILPGLIKESASLLKQLPGIIESLSPTISSYLNVEALAQNVPNLPAQFFDLVTGIFSNTIFITSTLFFGFYFLLEENLMRKFLEKFLTRDEAKFTVAMLDKAEKRINAWFWGELVLMTIVGVMTFIGLSVIGMKYVVALSVLAGLLEVIPNIGPTISAIPAVLIGLSHSYFLGFANLALYFLVQQLENNLIVPIVMKKAVGLNPIMTLSALIIGGKVAGIIGAILAVPITLFLETVFIEVGRLRKELKLGTE